MKNISLVNKDDIEFVNHMLIGRGLEKTYKIRLYKDFKIISIDEISSSR